MTFKEQFKNRPLWWWLATWFGAGLSPKISGTVGSLAALPFAFIIHTFLGNMALLTASVIVFFIGWWASAQFVRYGGKGEDPKDVVIDEVAGQWMLLSVLFPYWQSYLVGFIVFRLFDIVKPWPISWVDRTIKGGLGIMVDDTMAAFFPIMIYGYFLVQYNVGDSSNVMFHVLKFLGGY